MSCFSSYWRLAVPTKSEEEIEAEKWLLLVPRRHGQFYSLRSIGFNRWYLVAAAFSNLFFVGSTLSIGFLDEAIDGFFLGKPAKYSMIAQVVTVLVLGLSAALIGPFIERRGPRINMAIATALVVLGWIFAELSIIFHCYSLLYVGTAVLVSAGYGITIIVSISTVQKWFPDLRGVSGISIASMGGGSLIWQHIYGALLHRKSDNIFQQVSQELDNDGLRHVFLLHGGLALVFMLLATMVLRTPPPNYAVNGSDIHCMPLNKAPAAAHVQSNYLDVGMTLVNYNAVVQNQSVPTDDVYFSYVKALSLGQCIFSLDFFFLYLAFAASTTPIVLFVSELPGFLLVVLEATIDQTNDFIFYTNIACALGNLVGPILTDATIRIFYANPAYVRKMVFMAFLLFQSVATAILVKNVDNINTFKWPVYIAASCSGGGFGLIPSLLADLFGLYNAGTMLGLILTSWCIGSSIIIVLLMESSDMALELPSHLQVLLIISIVGCVVTGFVRSSSMDRFYRGYRLTVCGKVVIQRPSRRLVLELPTKPSQDGPSERRQEGAREQRAVDQMSERNSGPPILLVHPDYHHFFTPHDHAVTVAYC
ncbi:hypothetical protein Ae201684_015840 [Aphanomyces euteiches]|uniref:Major facilitator superfamily (MFS) profile domain-containing protein n=1 Tax=Aphanomyces euteiches TaxID=100861 RepID=A0A6G0WE24_9STRA|nr:hypothetical protein Ae201684_015840 [Aphanomyces euteiches]KAH9143755.1 hypothetical protein AeRB84_012265 [Aphanomyces euteiches]